MRLRACWTFVASERAHQAAHFGLSPLLTVPFSQFLLCSRPFIIVKNFCRDDQQTLSNDTPQAVLTMESWENHDYDTNDTRKWVELMNISTVEFGVGPLPPNLIAITGWLADAGNITFDNDTIIVEHAGRAQVGSRAISPVVVGVAAAVAIIWASWWLYRTWSNNDFFSPRPRGNGTFVAVHHILPGLANNPDFMSADVFHTQLASYYPRSEAEHELLEKDIDVCDMDHEDVESLIELIRRMYELDLQTWAMENDNNIRQEELERMRQRSDAMLREVHRVTHQWRSLTAVRPWPKEERVKLEDIIEILSHIGERRHNYNQPANT